MFTKPQGQASSTVRNNQISAENLFSLPICVIMVWVMKMDELKKRKTPRYQSFDYNSSGVYFITICTQNRRCILSRIVGTGVPDCPRSPCSIVGTGVLDCPRSPRSIVGTGVLDCPQQTNFGRDIVFSADLCYNVDTPQSGGLLGTPKTHCVRFGEPHALPP